MAIALKFNEFYLDNGDSLRVSGRVDCASVIEIMRSGSISGLVKSKTIKIDIHSLHFYYRYHDI